MRAVPTPTPPTRRLRRSGLVLSAVCLALSMSGAAALAAPAARTIELDAARRGSLAMTLTWSGGSGPYEVLINPSTGEGTFRSGIDGTTLTVPTEPDRDYCFEVFGADGSESGKECVSTSR